MVAPLKVNTAILIALAIGRGSKNREVLTFSPPQKGEIMFLTDLIEFKGKAVLVDKLRIRFGKNDQTNKLVPTTEYLEGFIVAGYMNNSREEGWQDIEKKTEINPNKEHVDLRPFQASVSLCLTLNMGKQSEKRILNANFKTEPEALKWCKERMNIEILEVE